MARLLDSLNRFVRRASTALSQRERNTGRTRRHTEPPSRRIDTSIVVEYTPNLDGDPDPGEVVWTWVPFEDDPTLGKDRPVVVIGRRAERLVAVALTSKQKSGDWYVAVGTGDWDPKRRPSWAKVERLIDIQPDHVRREGAILSRRHFDDVIEGLTRNHMLSAS